MIQDRRDFLKKSTYSTLLGLIIPNVPFAQKTPQILLKPAEGTLPDWKNKELIILSDKPWNVETPPHLLDDKVTPVEKMFIRNNGLIPEGNIDINTWTLTIGGESVKTTKTFKIKELKEKFKHYTYQLTLECGGNGRSGYFPQTSGNQWEQGAVSCAEWTGVRLKDILADVGLKDDAVYIGYYGKDIHLSRTPNKSVISRGVPIKKALEDETLIAWAVNGKDIPLEHGFPLRLVIGGWPASVSGKWLDKIVVRNKEHDGEKMSGHSYRVPIHPIEPGEKLAETPENFKIIGAMPVKSLITYPKTGAVIDAGKTLTLRGHAWAGDLEVKEVSLSIDYGVTWKKCNLEAPKNRLAWQHWSLALDFSQKGYFEVWVKATDSKGITQPMVIPQWNPGGYLNNACHRIAVKIV
ncbi:sulfite oxidase [Arcicella rosea]|uniref:DMSO/TMAO reductase YedYZ molybdopterin-dependent catalytic subunit n=1 Tax=Arcicella rosea TaxID=502909 RepID=A0A841EM65_9BACT|nr:sulfite oxidase [Arcicella rosea]MBB6003264.1 DMSO/TMAO reductase YedYZ molybdopterin-dependent catalytic subunit [Arcicella rosea]